LPSGGSAWGRGQGRARRTRPADGSRCRRRWRTLSGSRAWEHRAAGRARRRCGRWTPTCPATPLPPEWPPAASSSSAALLVESDGQHPVWGNTQIADQVGHPIGEHPGLAGAGAGHHQHGTLGGGHRLALRGVEVGEEGGNRPRGTEYTGALPGESPPCDSTRLRAGPAGPGGLQGGQARPASTEMTRWNCRAPSMTSAAPGVSIRNVRRARSSNLSRAAAARARAPISWPRTCRGARYQDSIRRPGRRRQHRLGTGAVDDEVTRRQSGAGHLPQRPCHLGREAIEGGGRHRAGAVHDQGELAEQGDRRHVAAHGTRRGDEHLSQGLRRSRERRATAG